MSLYLMFVMVKPDTDLWASALENLSEFDRLQLTFKSQDKIGVLSELDVLTRKARDRCIEKRWKLR